MNFLKSFYDRRYPATTFFLLATTLVFISMFLLRGFSYTSNQSIYDFGALFGRSLWYFPSQSWRLLTATFVHIGLEHFLMNMVTLYFLGRQVEDLFGSRNFFFLYLMSGLMGNIFVFFFTPNVIAAGASTAIFGLFGAVVALRYVVRSSYIQNLSQSYLTLLVINLIFSFMPGISLAGHMGGLVGGVLCAAIFPVRGESRAFRTSQRWLALLAYLLLGGALLFLGFTLHLFAG